MSSDLLHWLLAAGAAGVVVLGARWRRSLSASGASAAFALGTIIVGAAGWWAGLLLVTFFASSSVLSRTGRHAGLSMQARGAERDAVQVLANGGVAVAGAVLFALTGSDGWLVAMAGAIAAANADTWSTEIGRRSGRDPRLVTTGRRVPAGTSGAVSGVGLLGALGGGALIAALAAVGWHWSLLPGSLSPLAVLLGVTMGGVAGSLLDSLLGATVQEQRWCATCAKATEQEIHRCGTRTRRLRGVAWINNDVVNLACALSGAGIAGAIVEMIA